jgi:hypothetical protein
LSGEVEVAHAVGIDRLADSAALPDANDEEREWRDPVQGAPNVNLIETNGLIRSGLEDDSANVVTPSSCSKTNANETRNHPEAVSKVFQGTLGGLLATGNL